MKDFHRMLEYKKNENVNKIKKKSKITIKTFFTERRFKKHEVTWIT